MNTVTLQVVTNTVTLLTGESVEVSDATNAVTILATGSTGPRGPAGSVSGLQDHIDAVDPHSQYVLASGTNTLTVGTSAPSSPSVGDLWVDIN